MAKKITVTFSEETADLVVAALDARIYVFGQAIDALTNLAEDDFDLDDLSGIAEEESAQSLIEDAAEVGYDFTLQLLKRLKVTLEEGKNAIETA